MTTRNSLFVVHLSSSFTNHVRSPRGKEATFRYVFKDRTTGCRSLTVNP